MLTGAGQVNRRGFARRRPLAVTRWIRSSRSGARGRRLVGGAAFLWRRDGLTKQVWLMLVLAVVMIVNVLIWTLPDKGGTAPVDRVADAR